MKFRRNYHDTRQQRLFYMLFGFGFCLAGYLRWPSELREQLHEFAWKVLVAFIPTFCG
ncbi:hypothetical protein Pr1d_35230 [Bythopirellula goksoeyrii]|uniref:Uncharacterized protein n=1 Tax=Bythopirellula goksoeyrii TaxID=1400387 RepID=A0A5B9QQ09_9BACT|nr:hypothetical protein Pr1d_35230 [Bythopirellula goksoeyrii]